MSVAATNATYDLPEEQEVLDVLRSFGVRRARLFGSAARRELTSESDIDLLVEMHGPVDYGVAAATRVAGYVPESESDFLASGAGRGL